MVCIERQTMVCTQNTARRHKRRVLNRSDRNFRALDFNVALPLATRRHCFSSGQMPLCEMP